MHTQSMVSPRLHGRRTWQHLCEALCYWWASTQVPVPHPSGVPPSFIVYLVPCQVLTALLRLFLVLENLISSPQTLQRFVRYSALSEVLLASLVVPTFHVQKRKQRSRECILSRASAGAPESCSSP